MDKATAELRQDGHADIPTLATPRLLLRGWNEDDIEPYVALCGSQRVMSYIGGGRPLSRDEVHERLGRIDPFWAQHGFGLFSVVQESTGDFIGMCGFSLPTFAPQIMPAVEIGWRLAENVWNQGYATEAAAAILDWGFATNDFPEVVAIVQRNNIRASHVVRRLGMVEGMAMSVGPTNVATTLYRLTEARWQEAARVGR
ncbi:MAG: GNAT family N-acetyltransferase [Acidimicrobiales bacterium]